MHRFESFLENSNDNQSFEKMNYTEFSENVLLLESEWRKMEDLGYTSDQINEGIWDILSSLGRGFTDQLKDYATDYILNQFGIKTKDPQGKTYFMAFLVKNIVEQIEFTNITAYFGKDSCKRWMDAIATGFGKALGKEGLQLLLGAVGFNVDMNTGLEGTALGTVRNSMINAINDSQFVSKIEKMFSTWLCPKLENLSISDLLKGKLSGDQKSHIENKIDTAKEKTPDIGSLFGGLDFLSGGSSPATTTATG